MLVQSGIAPLDDQVGGLVPGRPYVISGSPGTGKSVSCLEFLDVALERGEPAALLTHDDPSDVLASGAFLGMDLPRALRDERLVLIRYHLNFIRRFSRAPSTDVVFAELRRMLGSSKPVRLAIDSIVPFLEGRARSGSASMFALIQFIDQLETTSLLTYPGDLAGLYDKRLEPIVQRAAGVFHLSTLNHARRHGLFEVRKLRYQAKSLDSISFRIQAGAGFVVVDETGTRPAEEIQRKLLVLNMADPFPEELLRILERDHSVLVRTGAASAFSDLVRAGLGALLLNVRRDVIADALQLVRELRRAENAIPIVVVTPYALRSSDRTRALRAGADDFLSTNLPPEEFIARISSVAQRGRPESAPSAEPEAPIFLQPSRDGESYFLLDAPGFRNAVALHLARERAPFFTVVRAEPVNGDVIALADLALRMSRLDSGDLVGFEGRTVLLYLDGARPKELKTYLGRLNDGWRRLAGDDMAVETFGYPADENQVRSFAGIAPT